LKEININIKKRKDIAEIEQVLNNINKDFKLDEIKFVNLVIAVTEALINAIVHGNKNNPDKNVNISIKYDEKFLIIKIIDEGEGFKLDTVPDPTEQENIFKENGRGLFIMKSLVDNFEFISDKNGTTIILKMYK